MEKPTKTLQGIVTLQVVGNPRHATSRRFFVPEVYRILKITTVPEEEGT
jgi:hypothetical protein